MSRAWWLFGASAFCCAAAARREHERETADQRRARHGWTVAPASELVLRGSRLRDAVAARHARTRGRVKRRRSAYARAPRLDAWAGRSIRCSSRRSCSRGCLYARRAGDAARGAAGPSRRRRQASFAAGPRACWWSRSSRRSTRSARTRLFSVHMAQHLLIGDVAPLLLALGLSGPLLRPVLAVPLARLARSARRTRSSRCRSGRPTCGSGTCPRCTTRRCATTPSTRSSTRASSAAACCSGRRCSGCCPARAGSAAARASPALGVRLGGRRRARERLPLERPRLLPAVRRTRRAPGGSRRSPTSAPAAA